MRPINPKVMRPSNDETNTSSSSLDSKAMADAFSSSLAEIAAQSTNRNRTAAKMQHQQQQQQQQNQLNKKSIQTPTGGKGRDGGEVENAETGSSNDDEGSGPNSSSTDTSGLRSSTGSGCTNGAAQVTVGGTTSATASSSSSGSATGGSGSSGHGSSTGSSQKGSSTTGSGSGSDSNSNPDHERVGTLKQQSKGQQQQAQQHSEVDSSEDRKMSPQELLLQQQHHGHHHHHQQVQQQQQLQKHQLKTGSGSGTKVADGYGLPVPDDRLPQHNDSASRNATATSTTASIDHQRQQQQGHGSSNNQSQQHKAAVVVARLPPPKASSMGETSSSSGSGAESSERGFCGGGSIVDQPKERSKSSLLQPHHEPGFHTIRRTFHRLVTRISNKNNSKKDGGLIGICGAGDTLGGAALETDSSTSVKAVVGTKKYKRKQPSQIQSQEQGGTTSAASDSNKKLKEPKAASKKRKHPSSVAAASAKAQQQEQQGSDADDSGGDSGGNGSSSGSGTEGGYAGSASSNEHSAQHTGMSCSSPSEDSSEESVGKKMSSKRQRLKGITSSSLPKKHGRPPMIGQKQESSLSASSEIADFSSSESGTAHGGGAFAAAFRQSPSPSISSSDDVEEGFGGTGAAGAASTGAVDVSTSHKRPAPGQWPQLPASFALSMAAAQQSRTSTKIVQILDRKPAAIRLSSSATKTLDGKPPILSVGCDVMAHILTFLEPPDILQVLTMPLSKDWLRTFTRQGELWRVLCLLEPFKAPVEHDDNTSDESSDDDSYGSILSTEAELQKTFGKFRLLYTSFVRCMHYLSRIQEDALHGRQPSVIDYGACQAARQNIAENRNLQQFLARARGYVQQQQEAENNRNERDDEDSNSDISDEDNRAAAIPPQVGAAVAAAARRGSDTAIGVSDDGSSNCPSYKKHAKKPEDALTKKKPRLRYGHSKLTEKLLGPTASGNPGAVELPWSCAIYSIVNWMVAFTNVEGIQTMCLKVLPFLLEDEQQRITAQRAGLTDVVLRGMVMFPDSAPLHTAAFHTIVLLARPLGGHEGMLFHSSMLTSQGIFSSSVDGRPSDGRNGIAVMLDSMKRFQDKEILQAMSCWALVNIALAPPQKEMLVKLGGIQVTANAMTLHPYSAEVQFRAFLLLLTWPFYQLV